MEHLHIRGLHPTLRFRR